MSTSNLGITGLSSQDPKGGNLGGTPTALGLPDAAVIAQLANQFYAALPGRPTIPGIAADAQAAPPTSALPFAPPMGPEGEFGSLPVAPYAPPTSGISPPSDVELRMVPASLASVGGAPPPATAASPPSESSYYFLDPGPAALPGVAVGLAPAAASRLESGTLSTSPSPPSAIAQPAEPNLRSTPAVLNEAAGFANPASVEGGAPIPGSYAFYPELVAFQAATAPSGVGATTPSPVPPTTLPQEAGALPPAADIPPAAALAPAVETGPRPEVGSLGSPLGTGALSEQSFYFLNEPQPSPHKVGTELPVEFDSLPNGVPGLDLALFPFDSRTAESETSSQPVSEAGRQPASYESASRRTANPGEYKPGLRGNPFG